MQTETMQYLSDLNSWTNIGFLIQMGLVLMLVIGLFIALPDSLTTRLTKKDNFGKFLFIIGLVLILFVVGPALVPVVTSFGWVGIAFILAIVILAVVRYFTN